MIKFLIYLFESGLCLAVMYLVYYFFLKKETYFGFNRVYLNMLAGVILVIPLLHISIAVPDTARLESPVSQIFRFRSYYEQVIAMTDPEYETGYRRAMSGNALFEGTTFPGAGDRGSVAGEGQDVMFPENDPGTLMPGTWEALSLADVLLAVYLLGASFFILRFLVLIYWLVKLTRMYGISRVHGIKLISFSEDMSPFSFFRFIFMNREAVSGHDFRQILAHEKVHIRQRHSLDLMVAQGITVIQWFNPFAWLVRDAIKTTHEYIADDQVIRQGFGLHDYQALLLKQLITSRPVELVNNFNLKPIKTRIAMMTKIRSGLPAKLKALVVIPFALALVLLFADMSFRGPQDTIFNFSSNMEEMQENADLDGLWQNMDKSDYAPLLYFEAGNLQILEAPANVLEYKVAMTDQYLVLSRTPDQFADAGIKMKFRLDGEELALWWSDEEVSRYKRTGYDNSMDMILSQFGMDIINIDLPSLGYYRILDNQEVAYSIFMGYPEGTEEGWPALSLLKRRIFPGEISAEIEKEFSSHRVTDIPRLTAVLFIDREVPMKYVHELKDELRKSNALKFASAGRPADESVSPVLRHAVALPRLLPPMDAQLLDKEEVRKHGLGIFEINLSKKDVDRPQLEQELRDFLAAEDKYIIELAYSNETPYGDYIGMVDMVFTIIISCRDRLAREKYNTGYLDLPTSLQQEMKSRYPVTLTETNADESR